MSEPLTANPEGHGVPDPPAYAIPVSSVIDEQIDRDIARLQSHTWRCQECRRHGPAMDGIWHLITGVIYCDACFNAEAHA